VLRHGRPSPWARRKSSRITVAECFGCRIWIIANWQCSTASARPPRVECTIDQFIAGYCSEPSLAFNRIVVVRYRMYLESRGLAANTINQQLAAVRRLAHEAADSGLLSPELAAGISRAKGVKQLGFRSGNWLSADESSEVLQRAYGNSLRAKRDYAMLAMLFGCGFRRSELVGLELEEIQMRQGALGRGGSDRQGRPHAHRAHSRMGQSCARSMGASTTVL
jgi:site-specific recombinase XerC